MNKGQAFTALVVILFLIFAALGNALVLFASAITMLIAGFLIYRGKPIRGAVLAVVTGLIISVAIAALLFQ